MATTLDEFKVLLQQLIDSQTALHASVDAQLAETAALITAVQALLAKIAAGTDLTEVAAAVQDALTKTQASTAKLLADDASVQEALVAANEAGNPTP